ncbi:MAG TPA: hypothetical protein VGE34_04740 [Candidatus Saccharimonadales bacterium]
MLGRFSQRGDTIIEVLLAVGIFSLVAIGGMAIMNQGTNTAQRAVEITLVRQQIDAQAEALRAIHQAASRGKATQWDAITANSTNLYASQECPDSPPLNTFALDPYTATKLSNSSWYTSSAPVSAPPYAQFIEDETDPTKSQAAGIWIEMTKKDGSPTTPALYSFKINACWPGAGTNAPMRLSTIVNLYDIGFEG